MLLVWFRKVVGIGEYETKTSKKVYIAGIWAKLKMVTLQKEDGSASLSFSGGCHWHSLRRPGILAQQVPFPLYTFDYY